MIVQIVKRLRAALMLAAVTALSPLAAHAAEAQATLCHITRVGEVPLRFEHNEPLVEVSINGQPATFIVDTGSFSTMMFGGAAKALNLSVYSIGGAEIYGVGGKRAVGEAHIASFKTPGFQVMKDARVYVTGRGGSPEYAGLLGRDLLGQVDLEMDLAGHTLRLFKSEHCGDQYLASWTTTPEIADLKHEDITEPFKIGVLVNGHRVEAILDSGATTSVITAEAAQAAGVRPTDYTPDKQTSVGIGVNPVTTRVAVFDTVTIGDEQIKHARLQVGDIFAGDTAVPTGSHIDRPIGDLPEMLLGADFFRSHRVLLVTSQNRAYFTYSGGPVFQVIGDAVKPKDGAEGASSPPPSTSGKSTAAAH